MKRLTLHRLASSLSTLFKFTKKSPLNSAWLFDKESRVALKNLPKKTHPKKPALKKPQKNHPQVGFF
jgi:hypothetical protein